MSRESGRPATFTLFQVDSWADKWREVIDQVKQANEQGARVFPQVGSRPTGLVFGPQTYHPWMLKPTFQRLKALPLEERLAELQRPETRRAILAEENHIDGVAMGSMEFGVAHLALNFEQTFMLESQSNYEPRQQDSFAAIAAEQNIAPEALLYDHLMAAPDRLAIMFFTNYTDYNLDAVRQMQLDDATVTGLSDAGAHVSLIFDAVNPTINCHTGHGTGSAVRPCRYLM